MKKIFAILLCVLMLTFCACGGNDNVETPDTTDTTAVIETTDVATETIADVTETTDSVEDTVLDTDAETVVEDTTTETNEETTETPAE